MLFAVLMTVCLQSDPATCRQETVEFTGQAMACVITAQPVVVDWSDRNPEWRVASWRCKPA